MSVFVAPASALTETTPNTGDGKNDDCPAPADEGDPVGLKLDSIQDGVLIPDGEYGTLEENGVIIEISNSTGTQGNLSFDWEVVEIADGFEVTQVVVKASSLREFYDGGTSGSVTFTVNHWYSHVSFCLGTAEEVIDVCPNLDGDQTTLPPGYEYDEQENCVPEDDGETPDAPALDINGECEVEDTYTIPATDEDNPFTYEINETPVAAGTYDLGEGASVTIVAVPEPEVEVADGADTEWTFTGSNVQDCSSGGGGGGGGGGGSSSSVDFCPNLAGDQEEVPAGLVILNGICDVLPQGEVAGEVITAPEPTPEPAPAVEPAVIEQLPFTGSTTTPLAIAGMLLLALGGTLEVLSRKRKTARVES